MVGKPSIAPKGAFLQMWTILIESLASLIMQYTINRIKRMEVKLQREKQKLARKYWEDPEEKALREYFNQSIADPCQTCPLKTKPSEAEARE